GLLDRLGQLLFAESWLVVELDSLAFAEDGEPLLAEAVRDENPCHVVFLNVLFGIRQLRIAPSAGHSEPVSSRARLSAPTTRARIPSRISARRPASLSSCAPRRPAANRPALRAPAMPTEAMGTPGGIC